ncbi:MAG: ferrous iron transport protein A [Gemmataceae bacterium]
MSNCSLDRLSPGQRGLVVSLTGEPRVVQRLMEMGLLEGDEVELLAVAPLGDPLELRLRDSRLSLRREDAAGVEVQPLP